MSEPTTEAPAEVEPEAAPAETIAARVQPDPFVEEELLVEDVSIDGMCGVY